MWHGFADAGRRRLEALGRHHAAHERVAHCAGQREPGFVHRVTGAQRQQALVNLPQPGILDRHQELAKTGERRPLERVVGFVHDHVTSRLDGGLGGFLCGYDSRRQLLVIDRGCPLNFITHLTILHSDSFCCGLARRYGRRG